MLPYLLAIAGGYLIGSSQEKKLFAKGGQIGKYTLIYAEDAWNRYDKEFGRSRTLQDFGYDKKLADKLSKKDWDSLEDKVKKDFQEALIKDSIDSMKSMMESLYAYRGLDKDNSYLEQYRKSLGEKMFKKVFDEYSKELNEKYDVESNVYTDSEGLSYSSLVKKDRYAKGGAVANLKVGDVVKYKDGKYEAEVLEIENDNKYKGLSSVKIKWKDNGKIESAYLEDLVLVKHK